MDNIEATIIDLYETNERRGFRLMAQANPDAARKLIKAGKIGCPNAGTQNAGSCVFCDPITSSEQFGVLARMRKNAQKELVAYLAERQIRDAEREKSLAINRRKSEQRIEQILIETDEGRRLRETVARLNHAFRPL